MTDKIVEIAIAALIAGLTMTVIHLLAVWDKGKLCFLSKAPISYTAGVMVLGIPYVVLLLYWNATWHICAFVAIVAVSGAPIIAGHVIKKFKALRAENEMLREGLDGYAERRRMAVHTGPLEARGRKPPWAGGMD